MTTEQLQKHDISCHEVDVKIDEAIRWLNHVKDECRVGHSGDAKDCLELAFDQMYAARYVIQNEMGGPEYV